MKRLDPFGVPTSAIVPMAPESIAPANEPPRVRKRVKRDPLVPPAAKPPAVVKAVRHDPDDPLFAQMLALSPLAGQPTDQVRSQFDAWLAAHPQPWRRAWPEFVAAEVGTLSNASQTSRPSPSTVNAQFATLAAVREDWRSRLKRFAHR